MITQAISQACSGHDLSEEQMAAAVEQIMEGRATDAQIGAFLLALRMKGESIAEIAGAAKVMRAKATPVPTLAAQQGETLLDIVGTGGDGAGTFNVSTTAAFVLAGAGARVAKHGNRAVSGSCGAADLLEALGLPLDLTPDQVGLCIDEVSLGFLFAPTLHQATRHAVGPRKEIGLRTVFNLLGPLTNPAGADALLVGVYDRRLVRPLAEVLQRLGAQQAMVVHGHGGVDEISISGPTMVCHLAQGQLREFNISPEKFGLTLAPLSQVSGGSVEQCRDHTLAVLSGLPGPRRDMVQLNAAAALVVAGLAKDLAEGLEQAALSMDSGAAMDKMQRLVDLANSLRPLAAEA